MSLKECIKQVSKEQGIPEDVCYKAYMSAWKFISETAKSQNLSPDVPLEEFRNSRPNFNIRGIGKLYVSEDAFTRKNKRLVTLRNLKKQRDDKDNQND